MSFDRLIRRVLKPIVFVLCLLPFALLLWKAFHGQLGANPIEKITHFTGDWSLYFILMTLTITPLRRLTGQAWLIRFRRMLGLYVFFYALCHFLSYLVLDQFFDWPEIVKDIVKRPYITIGFASFVLLIPLALTSTNKMMKRLGGKRWQRLHQCVYITASGAVLHYLWLVKADARAPLGYGMILVVLLGYRAWYQRRQQRRAVVRSAPIEQT